MKKKTSIYLLALVPFLIIALLYEIVPLITVILKSFRPDGGTGFTLENYQAVFFKADLSESNYQQFEDIPDFCNCRYYHRLSRGEGGTSASGEIK